MIQGIGLVGAGDLRVLWSSLGETGPVEGVSSAGKGREQTRARRNTPGIFQRSTGRRFCGGRLRWQWPGCANLLMIGPAGSGKTMVARRLATILPAMTQEEQIEISKIYSVCNLLSGEEPLIRTAFPGAPSYGIGPGPDRRREPAKARGDISGHRRDPVSGRASGNEPGGPGGPETASGGAPGHHLPGLRNVQLSG